MTLWTKSTFLASCALLTLHGGTACTDDQPPSRLVRGKVTFARPVVGAAVTFETIDGRRLEVEPTVTSPVGVFTAAVPDAAQELVAVARGGTIDGAPFAGTLRARVEQGQRVFEPVNFLTTLAETLAHDETRGGYRRAVDRITEYFFVPEYLSFDFLSQHGDRHRRVIDNRVFVERAAALGFDTYLQALVTDIGGGGSAGDPDLYSTARVPGDPAEGGGAGGGAGGLPVEGMLSGAMHVAGGLIAGLNYNLADKYYGGDHAGWLLHMLITGGDMKSDQLKYLVDKVDVLDDKLTALTNMVDQFAGNVDARLNDLSRQLNITQTDIESLIQTVSIRDDVSDLQTQCQSQLAAYALDLYYDPVAKAFQQPTAKEISDMLEFSNGLLDTNSGVQIKLNRIHNALVDSTVNPSLLSSFVDKYLARLGGATAYADTLAAYAHLEAAFMYYVYWEVSGFNLYVEARHATGFDASGMPLGGEKTLENDATVFQGHLARQADVFLAEVRRLLVGSNQETFANEFAFGAQRTILTRAYLIASKLGGTEVAGSNLFALVPAPVASDLVAPSLVRGGLALAPLSNAHQTKVEENPGIGFLHWGAATTAAGITQQNVELLDAHHLAIYAYPAIDDHTPITETATGSAVGATWYDDRWSPLADYRSAWEVQAIAIEPGPLALFDLIPDSTYHINLRTHGDQALTMFADSVSSSVVLLDAALSDPARHCPLLMATASQGKNGAPDQVILMTCCGVGACAHNLVAQPDGSLALGGEGSGSVFEFVYVAPEASPPSGYLRTRRNDPDGNPTAYYYQPRGTSLLGLFTRDLVAQEHGFDRFTNTDPQNSGDHSTNMSGLGPDQAAIANPSFVDIIGNPMCSSEYAAGEYVYSNDLYGTATSNVFWRVKNTGTRPIPLKIDSTLVTNSTLTTTDHTWARWTASFAETGTTPSPALTFTKDAGGVTDSVVTLSPWAPTTTIQPGKTYDLNTRVSVTLGKDAGGTPAHISSTPQCPTTSYMAAAYGVTQATLHLVP